MKENRWEIIRKHREIVRRIFTVCIIISILPCCAVYDYFFTVTPDDALNNRSFNWVSDSTANVIYYFELNSLAAEKLDRLKKVTTTGINRTLCLMQEKNYSEKIQIFIVDSRDRMYELTGFKSNSFAYPRFNTVYAVYSEKVKAIGAHEFNHVIAHNLWGRQSSKVLSEGFAVYADDNWHGNELYSLCKYLLSKDKLLTIKNLTLNFNDHSSLITYPEAGCFIKFLYEEYGYENFRNLWINGLDNFETVYNITIKETENKWLDRIQYTGSIDIEYEL